jgi:hypothetical protein
MTQDEIIEMARQAGGQVTTWVNHSTIQKTTTFTFESPLDYYVSGEYPEKYHVKFLEAFAKLVAAKAIAELESQEPVAWMDADGNVSDNNDHKCFPIPLYTTPPQRTWVGLTEDDEIPWDGVDAKSFAKAIEAKLKEKNT